MTAMASGPVPIGAGAGAALVIERTTAGGVRVTCPVAPGWAAVARSPYDLARALEAGWREADVATYAARRGERYDLALHDRAAAELASLGEQLPYGTDEATSTIAALASRDVQTLAVGKAHSPLAWEELPDGQMRSPTGRVYGSGTQMVARVRERRAEMGVDTPA